MREILTTIVVNLVLSLFTATLCPAQIVIRGVVVDGNGKPLDNASVLLLHSKDSSLVKGCITAKNGTFSFEKIAAASYLIASSFSGYKDAYSMVFTVDKKDIAIPVLKIVEKITSLDEVTVTAKKPMFEQQIDRMVINVANSITSTGSTALEVLMRSPGITVNQQNNTISMNGKDGVVVLLNGKINRMPMDALVQLLAGMSSSNIEKIELITTPPANFDAEGNAGFINIIFKKDTQYGTNGSISATAGHGIAGGPVYAASINFNHRKEKWNLYGDYSFYRIMPSGRFTFYRKVTNGNDAIENFMASNRDDFRRNHNGRLGLDYQVSPKTVIGVLVSGFSNMYGMKALNTSHIFVNNKLDTTLIIDNPERHPLDNYSANVNMQHTFKPEQQLTVNVDYIHFKDANTLTYLNDFYDGNGTFLYSDRTRSNKETPITFWIAAADYTQKIGKKIHMEAGLKSTFSHFVNDVRVEREVQNNWKIDEDFTEKHDLDESIFAAYTTFNVELDAKTKAKAGLRYEYTNSNLGSVTQKNIVDKHYGNWFPSVFVSHTLNEKNSFDLSYSRRITRPTFNDMAPFVYFIDPNTYFSGNPALQPAISNAIKGDYLLKRFIFSLSYTHEKNTITDFTPIVDPVTNKQTLVAENQKDKDIVALTVSLPFTVASWWTMQNNMEGYWQQLNAVYKGAPLQIKQQSFGINTTQSFKLPKDYSIELNGNYQSGGLFSVYKVKGFTSLNFGIQKKLGTKGGSLLLNVTDFSGPPHYKISVDVPEQNLVARGDLKFAATTVKLTYTRKFGNTKVKENRSRATGAEDEQQRVHTN